MSFAVEAQAVRIRRRRVRGALQLALPAGLSMLLLVAFAQEPLLAVAPLLLMVVGVVAVSTRRTRMLTTSGYVRADAGGLWLEETRLAAPEALTAARWFEEMGRVTVRIAGLAEDHGWEIDVGDQASARRLIAALPVVPAERVTVHELTWQGFRSLPVTLSVAFAPLMLSALGYVVAEVLARRFGLGVGYQMAMTVVFSTVILGALWGFMRWSTAWVRIGSDGVRVRQYARSRFYSHESILRIEPWASSGWDLTGDGVDLVLRSGRRVSLRTATGPGRGIASWQDPVVERLESVRASHDDLSLPRTLAPPIEGLSVAGERLGSVAGWVKKLRSEEHRGHHRVAGVSVERLLSVVRDPRVPTVSRAASAVALSSRHDRGTRRQLLRVADGVVSPDLREVVELAAEREASEEELVVAMRKVMSASGQ